MKVARKMLITIRMVIKYIILLAISIFIIIGIMAYIYHPTYAVVVDNKEIGYINDKTAFQQRINDYMMGDDSKNIGYIQIDNLPEYKLCLLHKNEEIDENKIYDIVVQNSVPYYKYFSIAIDGEEKAYVATQSEAESIVQALKDKKSTNAELLSIINKYGEGKPEFNGQESIINDLYIEAKQVQNNKKVTIAQNTTSRNKYSANGNISGTSKGSGLINPVNNYSSIGAFTATHHGIDICASEGTPIYAAAAGTVSFSGWGVYGHGYGGYGNVVVITHGNGMQTLYGHCYSLVARSGQQVSQGQLIGFVGNTGMSYGNHCHFEVREGNSKVNPRSFVY